MGPADARPGLALAYRSVYGVVGSYIAARFAPHAPMRHALALGAVGLVLSVAGAIAMWDFGPNWYPVALVLTNLAPCLVWRSSTPQ